jgi:hypothetical protein
MARFVRGNFNPAFTDAQIDELVDRVLNKKTRGTVDPVKLWETGVAENPRAYVTRRWGVGKRENAVTRRVNTLTDAMESIPDYWTSKWKISRVWRITYRGDGYWDRPTVGYVAARIEGDAAELGLVKYMSVILCYTSTPNKQRIMVDEVGPGDWDAAKQKNMEIVVKMNEAIKEKQESQQKLQAEIDKLVSARMYALEGMHDG